ncbi:TIR domain-containing protein [Mesorhizobium amorphae]|uniref:TIR domain-containing protein n=1 Tax=Mesorhizobium amorphae TaxID=71433 RepID=UPI00177E18C5|nr:TIR domain-containing protein [Mesorhizobium amorphae]
MSGYHGALPSVRRKVFVSYHHRGDQRHYDAFSAAFHDSLQLLTDNSLERRIDSADPSYIMRRIRESHLHGSSCTIVLCGADTWRRKYVDWEIKASLDQQMGLVGIWLPTLPLVGDGTNKPDRLQDNIDANYAVWIRWTNIIADYRQLMNAIEATLVKPRSLIMNNRALMSYNR